MHYPKIHKGFRNRNFTSWLFSLLLISFFVILYWDSALDEIIIYPNYLKDFPHLNIPKGLNDVNYYQNLTEPEKKILEKLKEGFTFQKLLFYLYAPLEPFSKILRSRSADKWFLYGFVYTLLVIFMGIRFIKKWPKEKYQFWRTISVMSVQLILAFILPGLLQKANQKEFYFSYFWPLKIEYFLPSALYELPRAFFLWGVFMSFIAVPILTYFFGKRWYCSWVCGCGALANTAGDDFRHLSSKSNLSWKIEKISIYSVLALAIAMTILLFVNHFRAKTDAFSEFAFAVQKWYFFFISAGFAGVIGTGFYPVLGTRIWCRFGCPQAAILGILQVLFSRFQITTNNGLCIACGNCSTYCEMGIDVRSYAMQGKPIKRAACVGCGICQAVCPRGVLRLENAIFPK